MNEKKCKKENCKGIRTGINVGIIHLEGFFTNCKRKPCKEPKYRKD